MDKRAAYIFKTSGAKDFTSIALDTHVHKGNLRFFGTNRGHEIPTEETEKGFTFTSTGYAPGEWQFKVLAIGEFKRKHHKQVEDGQIIAAKIKNHRRPSLMVQERVQNIGGIDCANRIYIYQEK